MMEEVAIGGETDGAPTDVVDAALTDDSFEGDDGPPAERWAPIGQSISPPPTGNSLDGSANFDRRRDSETSRLRQLEDEQEQLNDSLLTLTTHFAQVQFRLQQICKAGAEEKEHLLKELEEFAFRGCPDLEAAKRRTRTSTVDSDADLSSAEHDAIMRQQRAKQLQLIGQLRDQLEGLERFAYESGEGGLPSGEVMEKQRVILDQLRDKIDLDLVDFEKLTPEDLQRHVDHAVKRLVNPMRVKEKLVEQLQTQITDLERFIDFLQAEGVAKCTCDDDREQCIAHGSAARVGRRAASDSQKSFAFEQKQSKRQHGAVAHSLALIQLYLLSQIGCQSQRFRSNELKRTTKGNHWGDLRAEFELAVDAVVEACLRHQNDTPTPAMLHPYSSDDEDDIDDVFDRCHEEIITAVRRDLCPALRDLLQHGMVDKKAAGGGGAAAATFGCFSARRRRSSTATAADDAPTPPHVWDALLEYYSMKHGREFSEAPVRKLSQSFNLENIGGRAVTSKQLLLTAVDNIEKSHSKLKRSSDARFKAFVSAALNHKKLVPWLRMVLRTRDIIDAYYAPWSYVAKTGCDDAFTVLEKLNQFSFTLPVDLAVRPFDHIKDAF